MKVLSVEMTEEEMVPKLSINLYQDRNGNWWASLDKPDGSHHCTSTYDDPVEALEATRNL